MHVFVGLAKNAQHPISHLFPEAWRAMEAREVSCQVLGAAAGRKANWQIGLFWGIWLVRQPHGLRRDFVTWRVFTPGLHEHFEARLWSKLCAAVKALPQERGVSGRTLISLVAEKLARASPENFIGGITISYASDTDPGPTMLWWAPNIPVARVHDVARWALLADEDD